MDMENSYKVKDMGTIDVKLNDEFEIEGKGIVPPFEDNLFYPNIVFNLVKVEEEPIAKLAIGAAPKKTYTLEARLEGEFAVEYQVLHPPYERKDKGFLLAVERYMVRVTK